MTGSETGMIPGMPATDSKNKTARVEFGAAS